VDLREVEWGTGIGFCLIRSGSGVVSCECSNENYGSTKRGDFVFSCETVSISRKTLLHAGSKYVSKTDDVRMRQAN